MKIEMTTGELTELASNFTKNTEQQQQVHKPVTTEFVKYRTGNLDGKNMSLKEMLEACNKAGLEGRTLIFQESTHADDYKMPRDILEGVKIDLPETTVKLNGKSYDDSYLDAARYWGVLSTDKIETCEIVSKEVSPTVDIPTEELDKKLEVVSSGEVIDNGYVCKDDTTAINGKVVETATIDEGTTLPQRGTDYLPPRYKGDKNTGIYQGYDLEEFNLPECFTYGINLDSKSSVDNRKRDLIDFLFMKEEADPDNEYTFESYISMIKPKQRMNRDVVKARHEHLMMLLVEGGKYSDYTPESFEKSYNDWVDLMEETRQRNNEICAKWKEEEEQKKALDDAVKPVRKVKNMTNKEKADYYRGVKKMCGNYLSAYGYSKLTDIEGWGIERIQCEEYDEYEEDLASIDEYAVLQFKAPEWEEPKIMAFKDGVQWFRDRHNEILNQQRKEAEEKKANRDLERAEAERKAMKEKLKKEDLEKKEALVTNDQEVCEVPKSDVFEIDPIFGDIDIDTDFFSED